MLDKLKIALTLLIVGTVAGTLIVGVHTLTEERIEANRLANEYADYEAIFPDMDFSNLEDNTIDLDQDILKSQIEVYDTSGNRLGDIFIGEAGSYGGTNTVLVGVDTSGNIVKVILTQTSDTANIVQGVIDRLDKFENQGFGEVDYDAPSGATQSYDSIWAVVDAASLMVEGDPTQEAFESVFENADSYDILFEFEDYPFVEEFNIRANDDSILGYGYEIDVDEDNTVFMILDSDDVFKGFVAKDSIDDNTTSMIEAYDDQIDSDFVDLSFDSDDILGEAIEALMPYIENTVRIDKEYLVRYQSYDDNGEAGTLYTGVASGFSGDNVIEVALNDAGEIIHIDVVRTNDTPDYIGPDVIDNLDQLYDRDSISEDDVDTFSGATASGSSVINVLIAAIEYHSEREGE